MKDCQSVLLLANGDPPPRELAQRTATDYPFVIAVDGAVRFLQELGLQADLVCGDFDSIPEGARALQPNAEWAATPDQYHTDLEKAILLALQRGARRIALLGAWGGRPDHALAACVLLLRYARQCELKLITPGAVLRPLAAPCTLELPCRPGDIVSLICFAPVTVTLQGVQWELKQEELQPSSQPVSNRAVSSRVSVTAHQGEMLACCLQPEAFA